MEHRCYASIIIDCYEFAGFRGRPAWCKVEVVPLADGRTLVIATELDDNSGTSVTNAAELIADDVCRRFAIDPRKPVWVEHYGYRSAFKADGPRTYDLVTFAVVDPTLRPALDDPSWRPMTDEDWRRLGLEPRPPVHYPPRKK